MRMFVLGLGAAIAVVLSVPAHAQYQQGTSKPLNLQPLPQGTTTGTAENGQKQITIPTGKNTYVYGQDASQAPARDQPGSTGATAGVGRRF